MVEGLSGLQKMWDEKGIGRGAFYLKGKHPRVQ